MASFVAMLPGDIAQGLIWGIMALGVYITFRILNFADMTVDGTFALDKDGNVVNKLTSVQEDGQTLIDQLRNQVYRLNSLIQK